jgi:hypothetical protein
MTGSTTSSAASKNQFHGLVGRVKAFFLVLVINVGLLAGFDLLLVKLDVLSPPFQYGLREMGFGRPGVVRSADLGSPDVNGVPGAFTIAMVGDSHSELTLRDPLDSHEFVLEDILRAAGLPATMISAGRGRYSPLQEYLLFKSELKSQYRPRLLLMNFYSGNDFYDMLRPDDRPHLARDASDSIVMREPVWITFVDPETRSWVQRSRLLWGVDEASSRLGYPRIISRLRMLGAAATRPEHSWGKTVQYLGDLRRSQEPRLGYPAAFAAQMLNQALFFHHFPESTEESVAFIRHLLQDVRKENPDLLLVLSPIPSAALVNAIPKDVRPLWLDTLKRTGLTEQFVVQLEDDLVNRLVSLSAESGWLFVDLRECLRPISASGELYNSVDFHINAAASKRIGRCQAEALLSNQAFAKFGPARYGTSDRPPSPGPLSQ